MNENQDYWTNGKWYLERKSTKELLGVREALISILLDELPLDESKYHTELDDVEFRMRIKKRYIDKE